MTGLCTINIDSSFHPETKDGAFACFIISDKIIIKYAARFKGSCLDSNDAELKGLANALYLLDKYFSREGHTIIVVNCDNQVVRNVVDHKEVNFKYTNVKNKVLLMLRDYIIYYSKEIKGHSPNSCGRNRVNNWCDQEASKARKTGKIYKEIIRR